MNSLRELAAAGAAALERRSLAPLAALPADAAATAALAAGLAAALAAPRARRALFLAFDTAAALVLLALLFVVAFGMPVAVAYLGWRAAAHLAGAVTTRLPAVLGALHSR
jgi:hypothetical protein